MTPEERNQMLKLEHEIKRLENIVQRLEHERNMLRMHCDRLALENEQLRGLFAGSGLTSDE